MRLRISYYALDDILLLENGSQWKQGANMAEDVVAYADSDRQPAAVELSGARKVLETILFPSKARFPGKPAAPSGHRPDEDEIDRVELPLTIDYDAETDTLILDSGLPKTYKLEIADGLIAYYDGEDEYGKFINAVSLENAANTSPLLRPYLSP